MSPELKSVNDMHTPSKIIHPSFRIDGHPFDSEDPGALSRILAKRGDETGRQIAEFIEEWIGPEEKVELQTSGSTGKPKKILATKEAMINSAFATGAFFGLKSGDSALLCMPVQYIAGKMMVVRAMVLGLELDCVTPSKELDLPAEKKYRFGAMVPMQVAANLHQIDKFDTLIVGGAAVSPELESELEAHPRKIYATYGMTETLTHVAVRRLGREKLYRALPGVTFSVDSRECLVVNAPRISPEPVVTNDVVDLRYDECFELLGRWDNVVNSGGVKLFPEKIEQKLKGKIDVPFFLAGEDDPELGQRLIMVLEQAGEEALPDGLFDELDPYEKPRRVYSVDAFEYTGSGKVDRGRTLGVLFP